MKMFLYGGSVYTLLHKNHRGILQEIFRKSIDEKQFDGI